MSALGFKIHGRELLRVQVDGQTKNLVVLRGNDSTRLFEAHPLVEGFNREHGTNLTVISHEVAEVAQTVEETWRVLPAYAVDASIAYEMPGTKLGKEIVFSADGEPRIVLATGKYKGEKNVALVALGLTSVDFKRDEDSIVLDIPESRLIVVPNFPVSGDWYMPHAETGVPHGNKVAQSSDARHLYRLDYSSYVGLLVRYGGSRWRDVGASFRASYCRGVVAEVPEGDVAKITSLLSVQTEAKTARTINELPVSADELKTRIEKTIEGLKPISVE